MRATLFWIMLAACVAMPALAATDDETVEGHAHLSQTVIMLDSDRIQPASATVDPEGVILFENQSVHPMIVRFVDPEDAAQKIHCHFLRRAERKKMEAKAPWLLFEVDGGKLTATVPPGRFASLCSFAPGTYTFTAQPVRPGSGPAAGSTLLPEKGQITVR